MKLWTVEGSEIPQYLVGWLRESPFHQPRFPKNVHLFGWGGFQIITLQDLNYSGNLNVFFVMMLLGWLRESQPNYTPPPLNKKRYNNHWKGICYFPRKVILLRVQKFSISSWWQLKYFFYFHPVPWGFMIQFDEHIFQMGWNHQVLKT